MSGSQGEGGREGEGRGEGEGARGKRYREKGETEGRATRRREGRMHHISCARESYPPVSSPRLLVR